MIFLKINLSGAQERKKERKNSTGNNNNKINIYNSTQIWLVSSVVVLFQYFGSNRFWCLERKKQYFAKWSHNQSKRIECERERLNNNNKYIYIYYTILYYIILYIYIMYTQARNVSRNATPRNAYADTQA